MFEQAAQGSLFFFWVAPQCLSLGSEITTIGYLLQLGIDGRCAVGRRLFCFFRGQR